MILSDLPTPAEAFVHTVRLRQGFVQAGNRCTLFGIMLSNQVSPQDQRGPGGTPLRVVARAAADLAKSRPGIEPPRRLVLLVDLEEHGAQSEAREAAQMQIEQPPREPAPLPRARHRNRED